MLSMLKALFTHHRAYVIVEINKNYKVLLRERKRHTARRVASTRYAALSNPDLVGGGVPHPDLVGGRGVTPPPPSRPGLGGVPHPDLVRGGTPSKPGQGGTATIQTWSGGYPGLPPTPSRPGWGVPHPDLVRGYPLTIQTWDGVPPTQT